MKRAYEEDKVSCETMRNLRLEPQKSVVPSLQAMMWAKLNEQVHPSLRFDQENKEHVDLGELENLLQANKERTRPCNTTGRLMFPVIAKVTDFSHYPPVLQSVTVSDSSTANLALLTREETNALLSNKLMGHTRFSIRDNTIHIRMDSFVNPEAWFEVSLSTNEFKGLRSAETSQKIQGRLGPCSSLYMVIRSNLIRIDDANHLEAWAQVVLPEMLCVRV
jgi:hypothetical protein